MLPPVWCASHVVGEKPSQAAWDRPWVPWEGSSGIPRSKTRGLMAPRAKTAKIWPGHILKLKSVPNAKKSQK